MGSKPTPGTTVTAFAGSDPPFSPLLRCTRSRRVWPRRANPIGARAGSAYLPCKEIERGSSSSASANFSPIIQLVGAPVVSREIQVRLLVGEPMRRARLVARTCRFSVGRPEFESPSRRHAHVAQLDKAPDYESGRCRFESCRVLQSSACRGAWPSLPALEAGDRWFKSTHADQCARVRIEDMG